MATYYVDGAGYNGKYSATAIVSNDEIILRINPFKEYTSNEMEYAAMFHCLKRFATSGDIIYSDSELVVKQLNGEYAIHAKNLVPLYNFCTSLLKKKKVNIIWIRRDDNPAGKILEKIKKVEWLNP